MSDVTPTELSGAESDLGEGPAGSPRTRWAAILWGLSFAAIAWFGIWMLASPARRDEFTEWLAALTPGTITATVLLAAGAVAVLSGLIGVIRHLQRQGQGS